MGMYKLTKQITDSHKVASCLHRKCDTDTPVNGSLMNLLTNSTLLMELWISLKLSAKQSSGSSPFVP